MATDNLHKYLNSQHPGWNMTKPSSSQQYLIFTSKMTISNQILTPAQKTKLYILVAEWIVSDTLLFSIVSSESFAAVLRYLNANIDLPSCETMKSTIQSTFVIMQKDVKILLNQVSKIDIQLHSVFADFNITNKGLCATTDGGSNMVSAIQLLKKNLILQNHLFHFLPHHCLAHILNLIVMSSLSPIKSSIEKVCNLVKAIFVLSSLIQELKELGQLVGEDEATCKILQDVST
ncbi:20049_t:CDS:2 [Racocetra persica]|uniref:20049_t:CDS:1 n=1 Tax=Racocetra persica TaxID=160502 RepID=A0ACA9MJ83_9GLOM|nr:20049_t:CDS:2 [Racocetra persica]